MEMSINAVVQSEFARSDEKSVFKSWSYMIYSDLTRFLVGSAVAKETRRMVLIDGSEADEVCYDDHVSSSYDRRQRSHYLRSL